MTMLYFSIINFHSHGFKILRIKETVKVASNTRSVPASCCLLASNAFPGYLFLLPSHMVCTSTAASTETYGVNGSLIVS